jgi:uncharacterized protein
MCTSPLAPPVGKVGLGDGYEGFQFGGTGVQLDDTLLSIEPDAAKGFEESARPTLQPLPGSGGEQQREGVQPGTTFGTQAVNGTQALADSATIGRARAFHGTAEISPATAKMRLVEIADEILSVLAADPNGTLKVTLEIVAEFPRGAADHVKRAVSENARSLGLKTADWE